MTENIRTVHIDAGSRTLCGLPYDGNRSDPWEAITDLDEIADVTCEACKATPTYTHGKPGDTIQCRARDWPFEDALYRDVMDTVHDQDGREILDATALAIAAMWQAPGTPGDGGGAAMAALASGCRVSIDDLLSDINHDWNLPTTSFRDKRALDCLATWAMNHDSREPAQD